MSRPVDRIGVRPVLVGSLALQAAGLSWIAAVLTPRTPYPALLVPLLLTGIGGSAVFSAAQTAVLTGVADDAISRASGLTAVVRESGGVLGIAVVSGAFAAAGGYGSTDDVIAGVRLVLVLCAAFAGVAALIGTATGPQHRPGARNAGPRRLPAGTSASG